MVSVTGWTPLYVSKLPLLRSRLKSERLARDLTALETGLEVEAAPPRSTGELETKAKQ
jgi:hypothetical protein